MTVTKEQILEKLSRVKGPELEGDIVTLGLVSDIFIGEEKIIFSITVPAERAQELEPLRQAAEQVVKNIEGVKDVLVALTAEKKASQSLETAPPKAPAQQPEAKEPPKAQRPTASAQAPAKPPGIPGIKYIIAVASGKGGVGKSTTSVNLALGLQDLGLKVGVLDADIYGPSMPRLLGIKGKPSPADADGKILLPMDGYGLKVMSIGFLVEEETPMIWRGPMVISALNQMMKEVAWGELDVLVVDMPPGTGDAQLTMAQQVPLAGAVIVSTPQDLALIDARKGLNMFKKTSVPILGIVENMSYHMCPKCGHRTDIFGHGGAEKEATKLGVRFLGAVPLHMTIREKSDAGEPVVMSEPDGVHAKLYKRMAETVWQRLDGGQAKNVKQAPKIVFESDDEENESNN
ncbi:MAG: iron-sulfur cluster carrier protein ApbC [Alphaproteobacteria bacterium]|nr:iron-sulfur cluster carrier protein ApbC [Alphaproteobacteria bacterium]